MQTSCPLRSLLLAEINHSISDQFPIKFWMSGIVAGLDFGNKNCVIAIPHNGGVDVITNSSSQRLTPSMVAYSDARRFYGDLAQNIQMQHASQTITELKRLVGLLFNSPEREVVSKLVLLTWPNFQTVSQVSLSVPTQSVPRSFSPIFSEPYLI
jgi:molecular chaperone DnaK (HSP70)